jgi:hypothetical protein
VANGDFNHLLSSHGLNYCAMPGLARLIFYLCSLAKQYKLAITNSLFNTGPVIYKICSEPLSDIIYKPWRLGGKMATWVEMDN